MHKIQKATEMHDQRLLEIKERHLSSFTVYSTPFIRAINKILIYASVSVCHFICYLLGIRVVNVQSNGHPPERKPVIMRRKHIWSVERMWVENPTTIQTRISKETKRFWRMVIGFPAADLR